MGYLKDFRDEFAQKLDGLSAEKADEALNFACNAVLTSYRNGQKAGREERRAEHRAAGKGANAPRANDERRAPRAWRQSRRQ